MLYLVTILVSLAIPYYAKNELNCSLPSNSIFLIWISDQESMVTDWTKEKWTPRPRCLPEHSRHMNTPYDTDAHCGFFCEQSTQTLFPACDCKSRSRLDVAIRVRSVRSQIGLLLLFLLLLMLLLLLKCTDGGENFNF